MLAKRIALAMVIIILLAVFIIWGIDFIQAVYKDSSNPERDSLVKEINKVNRLIDETPEPEVGLDLRLAQLEKELREEEQIIPDAMDSTTIVDAILKLAEPCDVTVTPMRTRDWSPESTHYMVYTVNIVVEGSYQEVENFVERLENELYNNLTIVSMEILGGVQTDSEDAEPDTANLQVEIYTRN
jgi:hypothetical protein